MQPVLKLENLSVSFETANGEVEPVRDVSLTLNKGEILALVGESGCGKTVMSQSIMKLFQAECASGAYWQLPWHLILRCYLPMSQRQRLT